MAELTSWIVNITVACLVCAVVEFIIPDGGTQRSFKFFVSVFIVMIFLAPLKTADFSVLEYTAQTETAVSEYQLEKEIRQQLKASLSAQLECEISAYLDENGIEKHEVAAGVNIDRENNINIEKITVTLLACDTEKAAALAEFIKQNYCTEPQIVITGEENE